MRLGDPRCRGYAAMRVYKAASHHAFHATSTAATNATRTFTFQAIRWRNPPIAEDPRPSGRSTAASSSSSSTATRIHRIVWRQGSMTYWISNSFMDYYPNKAMIEIAKSFVPVPKK